ncbi:unnamed protein product [Cylicostephanus goldi]|uniref:Replication protein A subunit n=1 Tax=Cylicostephanus goldi TaxID=71465 RepID=A0A3P6RNZ3_CYLGO|nr:unnamed protein product [Cylicostephanus goldi]
MDEMKANHVTPERYRKYGTGGELRLSTGFFQLDVRMIVKLVKQLVASSTGYPACYRLRLSDGAFHYSGVFVSASLQKQCARDMLVGNAENGGEILAITKMHMDSKRWVGKKADGTFGKPMLVIRAYELLSRGHPILSPGASHDGDKNRFTRFSSTSIYSVPWSDLSLTDKGTAPSAPVTRQPKPLDEVTPISMLTPHVSKWVICGLCTSKDEMKSVRSRGGQGLMKVFSFELTDKDGVAIRITAFDEAAPTTFDISYYVSGCTVKQSNKRFDITGHNYELSVTANTKIVPCHVDIGKPQPALKICPLSNVQSHKDENVNVLAIVDQINPVLEFVSRQGRPCVKRDVDLIDQSGTIVRLTLWADQAKQFQDTALGQAISIKGALVKEWNGSFSLSLASASRILLGPQIDGVSALLDWYSTERATADVKNNGLAAIDGSNTFERDLCFIASAKAFALKNGNVSSKGRYLNFKAMITSVKTDTALYKGCSNEGCSKKVVQVGSGQYRCAKCDTSMPTFKWAYMAQVELTDLTGSIWATLFSNAATKLFGLEAQHLGEMKRDNDGYVDILNSMSFKYFNWRVSARSTTYNEENRVQYTVLTCDPVPYDNYIVHLNDSLIFLQELQC